MARMPRAVSYHASLPVALPSARSSHMVDSVNEPDIPNSMPSPIAASAPAAASATGS